MDEIAYPLFTLILFAIVVTGSLLWVTALQERNGRLKGELESERAQGNEWKAKYQQLVEDVRKQANQPRNVPAPDRFRPELNNVMRASSSAEIRREFDRINARILDQDQAS